MTENKKLFIFLSTHLIVWTFIPSISNQNLPLDTIEALAWGSNLDWGFNKHPPMSAFAVELIYQIFGKQDWAYYLLSQLFVVSSFYVIYILATELLSSKKHAFLSILLLETIFFYNFTTPEFNVNVCELPFWALCTFYTWKCINNNKIQNYFFLGVIAGLGILSKYLFIYLIAGLGIFLIIYFIKEKRIQFKFIISLTALALTILPHVQWLFNNNFITITYGLNRAGNDSDLLNHILYPLIFLGKQFGILILFFIMIFFLIQKLKIKINFNDKKLLFLFGATIIPIILVTCTSVILGAKIRTMWMTPFYLFFGVLVMYIFQNYIDFKKLKTFYILIGCIFFISPSIYLYISLANDNKRTDYPGKEIAKLIENKIGNNSSLVSGDEWHAGNLSYHLKSRPKWVGYTKTFKNGICFSEFPPKEYNLGNTQKTLVCLDK
ncbi:MAG: glycosyltransferase family 39 protein [Pelagibacteraceae bacterium]